MPQSLSSLASSSSLFQRRSPALGKRMMERIRSTHWGPNPSSLGRTSRRPCPGRLSFWWGEAMLWLLVARALASLHG
uniref:Macaca fascicularis brain cDNA clone: QflA-19920, similar to human solute carrier family 13 (sodium/sulfate symporters),member 4 (SLC13A4), mRNA, RefSeq: NM_012450.2 n=1 Tax=Macaca fascicularis TaxID=9541 RepID=I7GCP2_MACFA|nr:unnamed protein product [Macaca fascicularis]